MFGYVVWILSCSLGFCIHLLNEFLNYNLTPIIIALNFLTTIVFAYEMYKEFRGIDIFAYIAIIVFNSFFGFCLIYSEPQEISFMMSTILSTGITISEIFIMLYCKFKLYKLKKGFNNVK